MARWVAVLAVSGCNLALNAVKPSSDRVPIDTGVVASDLLITEVVSGDANLKFVELYNGTEEDIDLSGYKLRRYSNGQPFTTEPSLSLDGSAVAVGEAFAICGILARFDEEYAVAPDLAAPLTIQGNGNDAYELVRVEGETVTPVDVFGEIGVDGVGTDWDYDGRSARRLRKVLSGGPEFRSVEWEYVRWGLATPGER